MAISAQQYAAALVQAVEESAPRKTESILKNFLKTLKRNHRLIDLELIIDQIEKYYSRSNQFSVPVSIEYAEKNPQKEIREILEKKYPQKEILISATKNLELIGGARIQFKDYLIDSSISSGLQKFKKELK